MGRNLDALSPSFPEAPPLSPLDWGSPLTPIQPPHLKSPSATKGGQGTGDLEAMMRDPEGE